MKCIFKLYDFTEVIYIHFFNCIFKFNWKGITRGETQVTHFILRCKIFAIGGDHFFKRNLPRINLLIILEYLCFSSSCIIIIWFIYHMMRNSILGLLIDIAKVVSICLINIIFRNNNLIFVCIIGQNNVRKIPFFLRQK